MKSLTKFYDMPGNITIENGVARIDMFEKHPEPDSGEEQKYVFCERVVLTTPGFVELYKMMSQVVNDLEKQGVLTKQAGKTSLS